MGSAVIENIKSILGKEVEEPAMGAVSQAIAKLISDGFVRKELYKEKLAELCALNEDFAAVREEFSTAANRITEFEEMDKVREEAETLERRDLEMSKALEAGGANPHFIKLLKKELCFDDKEFGYDYNVTEKLLTEKIKSLKTEYPYAFGNVMFEKAEVALRPAITKPNNNPWSRDKPNLDEQTRIYRENPVSATEMALRAGVKL
ncbi:MAG: hypothetical protein FWE91_10905 [Defluviitaleaceae bacterium]|nr:hypothetical protein [Defluviitaleaceae bacterium]MCL2835183.1 hypothetical protein [Defluviitaleaceae bacterium]